MNQRTHTQPVTADVEFIIHYVISLMRSSTAKFVEEHFICNKLTLISTSSPPRSFYLQAQFVLCIAHTIRAMFASDCNFPKFISALLLLNASIFFVLFMNFYVQNYKKRRSQKVETTKTTVAMDVATKKVK